MNGVKFEDIFNPQFFPNLKFNIINEDIEITDKGIGKSNLKFREISERLNTSLKALIEFSNQLNEVQQNKRKPQDVKVSNLPIFLTKKELETYKKLPVEERRQFEYQKLKELFTQYSDPTLKLESFYQKIRDKYFEKMTPEKFREKQELEKQIAFEGLIKHGLFAPIGQIISTISKPLGFRAVERAIESSLQPSLAYSISHPLVQTALPIPTSAVAFGAVERPIALATEMMGLKGLGGRAGELAGKALAKAIPAARVPITEAGKMMGEVLAGEAVPTAITMGLVSGEPKEALTWGGIATAVGGIRGIPRMRLAITKYDTEIENFIERKNKILNTVPTFKKIKEAVEKARAAKEKPPTPQEAPPKAPTPPPPSSEIKPEISTVLLDAFIKDIPESLQKEIIKQSIEATKLPEKIIEKEKTTPPDKIREIEPTQNPITKNFEPPKVLTEAEQVELFSKETGVPKEVFEPKPEPPPELPPVKTPPSKIDIDSYISQNPKQILEQFQNFIKSRPMGDIVVMDISEKGTAFETTKGLKPEKPTLILRTSPEAGKVITKEITFESVRDLQDKLNLKELSLKEFIDLKTTLEKWHNDVTRLTPKYIERRIVSLSELKRAPRGRPPKEGEKISEEDYYDLAVKSFADISKKILSTTTLKEIHKILTEATKLPVAMWEYIYEKEPRRLTPYTLQDYIYRTHNNILKPLYAKLQEASKLKNLNFSDFKNRFLIELYESYFDLIDKFPKKNLVKLTEDLEPVLDDFSKNEIDESEFIVEAGLFPGFFILGKNIKNLFSKGSRYAGKAIEAAKKLSGNIDPVRAVTEGKGINKWLKSIQGWITDLKKHSNLNVKKCGELWEKTFHEFLVYDNAFKTLIKEYENIFKKIETVLPEKYTVMVGYALEKHITAEQFVNSPEFKRIPKEYQNEALALFKLYRDYHTTLADLGMLPEEARRGAYYHHTLREDLRDFVKTDMLITYKDGTQTRIRLNSEEAAINYAAKEFENQINDIEKIDIMPSTLYLDKLITRVTRRKFYAAANQIAKTIQENLPELTLTLKPSDLQKLIAGDLRKVLWVIEERKKWVSSFLKRKGVLAKYPEFIEWNPLKNMRALYKDYRNVFLNDWYKNSAVPVFQEALKIPQVGKIFAKQTLMKWIDRQMGWEVLPEDFYTYGWWNTITASKPSVFIPRFFRKINALMALGFNFKAAAVNAFQTWMNVWPDVRDAGLITRAHDYYARYLMNPADTTIPESVKNIMATYGFDENAFIPIKMDKISSILLYPFHAPESVNRPVTAIIYDLFAREKLGMTDEYEIRKFVLDKVGKTQFYYSPVDVPLGVKSEWSKLLFQFKTWLVKETELFRQEFLKSPGAVLRHMAVVGALGGVTAIPFGLFLTKLVYSQYKKLKGDKANPFTEYEILDAMYKHPFIGGGVPAGLLNLQFSYSVRAIPDFEETKRALGEKDLNKFIGALISDVSGIASNPMRQVFYVANSVLRKYKAEIPWDEAIKEIFSELETKWGVTAKNLHDAWYIFNNKMLWGGATKDLRSKGITFVSDNPAADAIKTMLFGINYKTMMEREKDFAMQEAIENMKTSVEETANWIAKGLPDWDEYRRRLFITLKRINSSNQPEERKKAFLDSLQRVLETRVRGAQVPAELQKAKTLPEWTRQKYMKGRWEEIFEKMREMRLER